MLRSLIRKAILEATELPHFQDRVSERLSGIQPPLDPKFVKPALDLLRKVNFPGQTNVAVNIFRSGAVFTSYVSDKATPTVGNNMWAIIRGNELETIVFTSDKAVPQNTQYQITIAKLNGIVTRNGFDLSLADLEGKPAVASQEKKPYLDMPKVIIRGKEWFADVKREVFLYAKNIQKVMTFDQAFEELPERELDAIMDQLAVAA